jgi:hypothetical protein
MLSLAVSMVLLKEQSFPPNPLLQVQDTEQRTSKIEQIGRMLPDGSEYMHAPFEEHMVPVLEYQRKERGRKEGRKVGERMRKRWGMGVGMKR